MPERRDDRLIAMGPDREAQLEATRQEAAGCRRCPLWEIGTRTVFGEGPAGARLMLIGEAPGYQEDKQGRPFVGPAGRLLMDALAAAGLPRDDTYITNTVKHRPWVPGGRQGKNRPPKAGEIKACRPWLDGELAIVRPALIGCLGAPAAKSLLGRDFRLTEQRGEWFDGPNGSRVLATVHPSFILMQPGESQGRWREIFFADLARIAETLRSPDGSIAPPITGHDDSAGGPTESGLNPLS